MKKLFTSLLFSVLAASSFGAGSLTLENPTACGLDLVLHYDIPCVGNNFLYDLGVFGPNSTNTHTLPNLGSAATGGCGNAANLRIIDPSGNTVSLGAYTGNNAIGLRATDCNHIHTNNCTDVPVNLGWVLQNPYPYTLVYQAWFGDFVSCGAWAIAPPGSTRNVSVNLTQNSCDGTYKLLDGTPITLAQVQLVEMAYNDPTTSYGGCGFWLSDNQNRVGGPPTAAGGGGGGGSSGGGGGSLGSGAGGSGGSGGTNAISPGVTNNMIYDTNSANIPFTNGSSDGQILERGFNALYDIESRGFASVNQGLDTANQRLWGATNQLQQVNGNLVGLSNAISRIGFGTNNGSGYDTNTTAAVNSLHRDDTNYLAEILSALTNTQTGLVGVGTNYDSAMAIANGVYGTFSGNLDAMIGGIHAPSGAGGGGAPVAIALGNGFTMQATLMPGEFQNMWTLMSTLFKWVLVASYLTKVAIDSYKIVEALGSAQQLSLPNLNAEILGVGGNWGALLAPILLVAIITIYGVALGALGTSLTGAFDYASFFSADPLSGASGAVANGVNYLKLALPFDAIFGLTGAYIVFRLTLTKVLGLAVIAVRALVGG